MIEQAEKREGTPKVKRPKKIGLIYQVIILFMCITLGTAAFTFFTQYVFTELTVKRQTEEYTSRAADQVIEAIKEYPSYRWLVAYWYENWDKIDIEYDVDFSDGTRTKQKEQTLREHAPDFQIRYATVSDIEKLSAEDQKLYAEIAYSWTITRLDQIKQTNEVAFLFCVLTDDDKYKNQFFLLSGADKGATRGTNYEDIYTLGVRKEVSESQQMGMKNAREKSKHLVDAGKYVDYYAYVDTINNKDLLIGMTYDLSSLYKDIKRQTWEGTAIAVVIELILAWICIGLIFTVVINPVRKIQETIRMYMRDKNSAEVADNLRDIKMNNEIGQLSLDVRDMAREIDSHLNYISTITKEKERINAELNLATSIQLAMIPTDFPPFPDRDEIDIYALMEPAKEVGGDFYNYFFVDEDHLCLLIADVSGKGVPAAMMMMASQIILANNVSSGKHPEKAMEDANELICSNNRQEMFVTVWLGILDIRTGKITAVNAGHEYPAIGKADGSFELIKDKHDMVVGALEGLKYHEYEFELEPGDKLFVYTDGVPEATNDINEQFGNARMVQALNLEAEDPKQIIENVRGAVGRFVAGAEQFDDITMLCIEYKGKEAD